MDYLILIIGLLLLAFIILLWKYAELKGRIEQRARQIYEEWRKRELESTSARKAELLFEEWRQKYEKEIRRDAIEKSKAVIAGKVTEHLIPYLPEFKYNPKDARFIGSPVDLIVFDGLDEGDLRRIVFVEVKSGKSTLSKREKLIRDAIEQRKVEWVVLRVEHA
ncbi:Holliday junction resolvase [Archaeoglobales archaeon]|nr:MAG: Holliday junction resolvase [Archaeoglobales archaeon ex4484_92]RLI74458.1 MAG: Holliday junction resolvase [Archaeoglobales archaeon]